jgi:hypothetical protein
MALQTKWVVSQLDTAPSEDGLTDIVKTVHWRYQGQDEQYFAEVFGDMACATPSATNFTDYADLTYSKVCEWLAKGLDNHALDSKLEAQIQYQKNPPIVVLPLPFENPTN